MKVTTYPFGQSGKKRKKKVPKQWKTPGALPDPKYEFLKRFRGEIKNAP